MTELRINIAADINRAHELASQKADEAIEHAVTAGKLLLEAKAALPHGEWLTWLDGNVFVTARQVQRYMRVAQGKPLPIRAEAPARLAPAKYDTVSHLIPDPLPEGWTPTPTFMPRAGHWAWAQSKPGAIFDYVIEPASKHPGYFFVSHILLPDGDEYDCTRRPVRADWVEIQLSWFGLDNPASLKWYERPSDGVLEAMETLNAGAEVTA